MGEKEKEDGYRLLLKATLQSKNLKTEREVAQLIGCSSSKLETLRKKNLITPIKLGGKLLYDDGEVEKAKRLLAEKRRPTFKTLTCETCRKEFTLTKKQYYARFERKDRPRKLPFAFCGKSCFGKFIAQNYGFVAYPEHRSKVGAKRKYDYSKIHELWLKYRWPLKRFTLELGTATSTISRILKQLPEYRCRERRRIGKARIKRLSDD